MNEEDQNQKRIETLESDVSSLRNHAASIDIELAKQAKDQGYIVKTVDEIKTTVTKLEMNMEQILHKDLSSKPAIDLIYGAIKLIMVVIGTLVIYFLLSNISQFVPENSTTKTSSSTTSSSN